MTVTADRPAGRTLSSTWHSSVAALPAEHRAPTPFHSREWAAAWQSVRTEQILGRHHLLLQDGPDRHRMSFYQVHDSPLWRALEGEAEVTARTWNGSVLYGPSVYGQYGGMPGAPVPVLAEAIHRGVALARKLPYSRGGERARSAGWDGSRLRLRRSQWHRAD
ncbi:hypothetical protein, partial [Streptomyces sp. NPDC002402]